MYFILNSSLSHLSLIQYFPKTLIDSLKLSLVVSKNESPSPIILPFWSLSGSFPFSAIMMFSNCSLLNDSPLPSSPISNLLLKYTSTKYFESTYPTLSL